MTSYSTPPSAATPSQFLHALFDGTDGAIELRAIEDKKDGASERVWLTVNELVNGLDVINAGAQAEGKAVFFGVLPREPGKGTADDVLHGRVVWADVDFKSTPENEAWDQVLAFTPSPNIIVHSGRGLHLYWLLENLVSPETLASCSRKVANALKADHCHDAARILRLPGSMNLKACWDGNSYTQSPDAPVCTIALFETEKKTALIELLNLPEPPREAGEFSRNYNRKADLIGTELPPVVEKWLEDDKRLMELWCSTGKSGGDVSNSGYDISFARRLVCLGVTDPDILDAAVNVRPRTDGGEKNERDVQRAVDAAIGSVPPLDVGSADTRCVADALRSMADHKEQQAAEQNTQKLEETVARIDFPSLGLQRELDMTELGTARLLLELLDGNFRWITERKCWASWNDGVWDTEEGAASAVYRQMYRLGDYAEARVYGAESEQRARYVNYHNKVKSSSWIAAVPRLTQAFEEIATSNEDFDQKVSTLNVKGSTVDLVTGKARLPAKDDLLSMQAPTDFKAGAKCPRWHRFIREIMGDNEEHALFLQRALGYSISGECSEQKFFVAHGKGANGKGTMQRALTHVLGKYVSSANSETFAARRGDGEIPADAASWQGARLVFPGELPHGKRLNTTLLKACSGQDKLKVRFMRENFFEYTPQFVLWLATNTDFRIEVEDNALARRFVMIPFPRVFATDSMVGGGAELDAQLEAEAEGILQWLLEGYQMYRKDGLRIPAAMLQAAKDKALETDQVAAFISDCCIRVAPEEMVRKDRLFDRYTRWCEEAGETRSFSRNRLSVALAARGWVEAVAKGKDRVNFKAWVGVQVVGVEGA